MIGLVTERVDILRGSTTNVYGDEVDSDVVVQSNVPFGVNPASQQSTDSADERAQEVEYLRGRLPAGTDVRVNDRLRGAKTGFIYLVTGSHQAINPIMAQDVAVELTRTPTT